MKEPKLYGPWPKPGGREQSRVQWYEGRVRKSKAFANHGRAELFYRSKFSAMPSNEAQALLFEQVSIIKKAVSEFVRKESDLEKENLRLRRELSATEQHSPAAGGLTGGSLSGRVLITRPGLVLRIQQQFGLTGQTAKNVASLIQQLHYLIHERALGRIHKDGRRYVWFTYEEWKETQFPHWSKPTIKRTFAKAENLGLVLSRQPEGRVSRRKHYSLTPEGINLIPSGMISVQTDPIKQIKMIRTGRAQIAPFLFQRLDLLLRDTSPPVFQMRNGSKRLFKPNIHRGH